MNANLHEYRIDKTLAIYAFGAATIIGVIGAVVGENHGVVTMFLATGLAIYALVVCFDNRIRLSIDDSGIKSNGLFERHLGWREIDAALLVEKTRGASIRHYLRITTLGGEEVEFEVSRLNRPVEQVLGIIGSRLGIRW